MKSPLKVVLMRTTFFFLYLTYLVLTNTTFSTQKAAHTNGATFPFISC